MGNLSDQARQSAAPGGNPSKATTWNLLHHQWSSMEVPLPSGRQQGVLYEVNSAAPPMWVRGQYRDPAKKTRAGHQGTKESAGGAQGRRRREGAVEEIFHFHWKVKVAPT